MHNAASATILEEHFYTQCVEIDRNTLVMKLKNFEYLISHRLVTMPKIAVKEALFDR